MVDSTASVPVTIALSGDTSPPFLAMDSFADALDQLIQQLAQAGLRLHRLHAAHDCTSTDGKATGISSALAEIIGDAGSAALAFTNNLNPGHG